MNKIITTSFVRLPAIQQERFRQMQLMLIFRNTATSMLRVFAHEDLPDYLELTPILRVYKAPFVIPPFRPYMIFAFDYEDHGMNCTHFKEKISIDMIDA